MNPYGICGHTKYPGGPGCVHSAYDHGYVTGLLKAVTMADTYVDETRQHRRNAIGMCAPLDGDRCDITAAVTALRNRIAAAERNFAEGRPQGSDQHDPMCPSIYTFTACECALIAEVRADAARKSGSADTEPDVRER